MSHSDIRARAVQSLVQRVGEYRSNLLNLPGGSAGPTYHHISSVAYGAWELTRLFKDVPAIGAEQRTMEGISSYMSAHREHEFYCQVELWSSLNTVLDLLAKQGIAAAELYGSSESCIASARKALEVCKLTLSRPHVDFQYARFLLIHAARAVREAEQTLPESDALHAMLSQTRYPLTAAIASLEKETTETAAAALGSAGDAHTLLRHNAA